MFLDFYELKEQPFGVTPDPHYLYLGGSHREALASMFYGVKTGRGLLALVAPPGMGKTTLLFRLLEHLRRSARTAFLFQTQCDSCGLLRYLMGDLGIDTRGQDFVTMHEQLNELLLREASAGRRFVLVIDEAQNLDDSVLETARLLSDFETASKKLLQIVFAGQSQLAEKLQRPELAQLRQRISILGRLEPFSAAEVNQYINHRLRVAGYNAGSLFTPAAFERIAANSKGIPRNINNLCFNALSLGCALGRKQIDADLIREAEADLDLSSLAEQRRRELLPVVLPVPPGPTPPAAEVRICRDADATTSPSRVGSASMKELLTWNGDPANTNQTSQPFSARRDESAAADGAGILILESFEHAQERNAEILAEIVGDGTSDDAYYVTHPENCDAAYRVIKAALKDAELTPDDTCYVNADRTSTPGGDLIETTAPETLVGELANQLPVSSTNSMTVHLLGGADGSDATSRLPIFYAAESKHTVGRMAVVASLFVLALFAGVFYRQDLKIAAAQTRGTLTLVAARLSSHLGARKAALVTPPATMEQVPEETGFELSDRGALVTKNVPAITTSVVATQAGVSLTPARERQAEVTITRNVKHLTSPQAQFTHGNTAIIVQPHDDLRRICLRHLGWYNAEVLREIRELNPELSDPDSIAVGQRIVLPGSPPVRPSVPRSSSVPSP
jgi:type II secretory pathway predicted ATPase ExeA